MNYEHDIFAKMSKWVENLDEVRTLVVRRRLLSIDLQSRGERLCNAEQPRCVMEETPNQALGGAWFKARLPAMCAAELAASGIHRVSEFSPRAPQRVTHFTCNAELS